MWCVACAAGEPAAVPLHQHEAVRAGHAGAGRQGVEPADGLQETGRAEGRHAAGNDHLTHRQRGDF